MATLSNRMRFFLAICSTLVAIAATSREAYSGDAATTQAASSAMQASDLMYEFANDFDAAYDKYQFKKFEVVGVVDEAGAAKDGEHVPIVKFVAGFSPRIIYCTFDDDQASAVGSLKPDQVVKVEVECMAKEGGDVMLLCHEAPEVVKPKK